MLSCFWLCCLIPTPRTRKRSNCLLFEAAPDTVFLLQNTKQGPVARWRSRPLFWGKEFLVSKSFRYAQSRRRQRRREKNKKRKSLPQSFCCAKIQPPRQRGLRHAQNRSCGGGTDSLSVKVSDKKQRLSGYRTGAFCQNLIRPRACRSSRVSSRGVMNLIITTYSFSLLNL